MDPEFTMVGRVTSGSKSMPMRAASDRFGTLKSVFPPPLRDGGLKPSLCLSRIRSFKIESNAASTASLERSWER
jgi:hypothetical protein